MAFIYTSRHSCVGILGEEKRKKWSHVEPVSKPRVLDLSDNPAHSHIFL